MTVIPAPRKSAVPLARLVARILDPVTAKRGFAQADLIASWDDIVGGRHAGFTQPEKLSYPRGPSGPGILTIRVEGARALLVQHETAQIMERINAFLGFPAVGEIRILQRPIARAKPRARPAPPPLKPAEAASIDAAVADVESDAVRESLRRLGAAVIGESRRPQGR